LFLDPYRRQTIVVCTEDHAASHKANDLQLSGVTVLPVPTVAPGQLDLCELLRKLGEAQHLAQAYQVLPISCEPVDRDFHVLATPLSIAVPQWCQQQG